MQIVALSGSLSSSSGNTAVLRALRQVAWPRDDVVVFDGLDAIPHYSPERDRDGDGAPAAVAALRGAVGDADALVISTPEYAGGMPGVLKNALDWLVSSGELYGKPVVVVSAEPSALRGEGARQSLAVTLRTQGASVCDSFTVALRHGAATDGDGDDGLWFAAGSVLARVRRALTSSPCAELVGAVTSRPG
jgi:NAD(P)H-dependent FMN reductase